MKCLVTGGCGFLGANLSSRILKNDDELIVFDNLSRTGSQSNLEWLKSLGDFTFICADIRNKNDVENAIKKHRIDHIFHLAGQVAMTKSIDHPKEDFEINALGTLNILEALRYFSPETSLIYSSTNKVYGEFDKIKTREKNARYVCPEYPYGFDESQPLHFHSPYACSKGSADQYVLDYNRIFSLKTSVFRHSSIYGWRQYSTFDQGWIAWFCRQALEIQSNSLRDPFTICGNGKQVRDILFVDDAVDCYLSATEKMESIQGEAFNIGGGMNNSLSLLELFSILEEELGVSLLYKKTPWRASDQKIFVADNRKALRLFSWTPKTSIREGIKNMIHWLLESDLYVPSPKS